MSKPKTRTILLVEDEEAHAELVRKIFETNSPKWMIYHVSSLKEAQKWLAENEPLLIIADYNLPDGTGLDLTKGAANPEDMRVPLIILTGYGSERLAVRALKSGALDFVVKSAKELQELPWTVERVLREWKNITKRKYAEEALRASFEKLKELDKMKSNFLHVAYHELRSPLAPIIANASLLEQNDFTDKQKRSVYIIGKSAEQLEKLIDQLLEATRIEAGTVELRLEVVSIPGIVKNALERLKPLADAKNMMITIDVPDKLEIEGDAQKIAAIFNNIASNAIKYTEEKGGIEIKVADRNGDIVVSIADTGIGISEEHIPRVFERFFMVDCTLIRKGGLGLGLAIVKEYVKLHGGVVWVTSELGKGSNFFFSLPKKQKLPAEES